MKKHFWRTAYQIFHLKELSRAINWEQLSGGSYLEGNQPGVIIQEAIIQAPIVWGQFFQRPLSGGNFPGGGDNCPEGQYFGGQLPGAIIRRVIVQGTIVLKPFCTANNLLAYQFLNIICSRCCVCVAVATDSTEY